ADAAPRPPARADARPDACEREQVRRRGFIGARVRASSDTPAGSIADAMKEFSEVVAASASALLDGQFDDTERRAIAGEIDDAIRSEEHTSEAQSRENLVC